MNNSQIPIQIKRQKIKSKQKKHCPNHSTATKRFHRVHFESRRFYASLLPCHSLHTFIHIFLVSRFTLVIIILQSRTFHSFIHSFVRVLMLTGWADGRRGGAPSKQESTNAIFWLQKLLALQQKYRKSEEHLNPWAY